MLKQETKARTNMLASYYRENVRLSGEVRVASQSLHVLGQLLRNTLQMIAMKFAGIFLKRAKFP